MSVAEEEAIISGKNQEGPDSTSRNYPKKRSVQPELGFRGVRRRSWGRFVSEIRLPKKKTRVWLGSFVSPEKAARAYDSAAFYLRGKSATLNFPESAGSLPQPLSSSTKDIQLAAAKAALDPVRKEGRMEMVQPGPSSGSGSSSSSDQWWGQDEELMNLFEDVKEAPLHSPLRFDSMATDFFAAEIFDENGFFVSSEQEW